MLTKIKTSGKKMLSLVLAFIMSFAAFAICQPLEAEAISHDAYVNGHYYYYPEGTRFISSIQFGQDDQGAVTAEEASANGHTILTVNGTTSYLDLNSGVKGKDYIYLGYKTSTNINDSIGTYLRNGHDNSGVSPCTFDVEGTDCTFYKLGGGQDLNADAGGDYIYLYATKDTAAGLPLLALTGSKTEGDSINNYQVVYKNNTGTASDCNAGAGGDYVYIYFDNSSVYTDVTEYVNALRGAIANTVNVKDQSKYTSPSWAAYNAALTEAYRIVGIYSNTYNAGYVKPADISAATTALNTAMENLTTTITLNANGGTCATTTVEIPCGLSGTVTFLGSNYPVTPPAGKDFIGWNTSATATSGSTSTMTVPIGTTLYAIFAGQTFAVHFYDTVAKKYVHSQNVAYGGDATAPIMEEYITKDESVHYHFTGWDSEYTNISENKTINTVYEEIEHTYEVTGETAATCKSTGLRGYTCEICGQTKTETLPVDSENHANITYYYGKESTCNSYGYTGYEYCNDCKQIVSGREQLPLAECTWSDWVTTEPTCILDGSKTRTCSVCKKTETEVIPATGHTWGEFSVTVEPKCESEGRRTRECETCGDAEVEIIPALGHDYKAVVTAPTCTEQGYTTHTCSRCTDSYVDTYVDATGHNWQDVGAATKEPTCTETGLQNQECSICHATQVAVTEALGHDWTNETVITEATCTTDGLMSATCDRCGEVDDAIVIPAKGHSYTITVVKKPTCTTEGTNHYYCTVCTYEKDVAVPATGHKWDDGVVTKEPTCSEEGQKVVTCETCGETKTTAIEKLRHSYTGTVTAPTCTEQGYTTYVCVNCNETLVTDYVPAAGHKMETTVFAPTCTMQGFTYSCCTVCGINEKSNYTEPTGHNYVTVTVPAECLAKGYDIHTCSVCTHSYKDNYTAALGHEYETTTVAPTCRYDGYDLHECTRCDVTYEDNFVEATGHSYVETGRVDYTEVSNGYILYTCETCGGTSREVLYAGGAALVCETLYDDKGNPVVEAQVTITNVETGHSFVIFTDLNGYFTEVLMPGEYELVIYRYGCDDAYGTIYVNDCEAVVELPELTTKTCDCLCHEDSFWGFLLRFFMRLRILFGMEPNCCADPQVQN